MTGPYSNRPLGLILLKDVAASLGVAPDSIARALRRGSKRVYKVNRNNAATVAALEWYGARRERKAIGAPRRPQGWLGIKQAAAVVGVGLTTLHGMLPSPALNPVRVGLTYFFNPVELAALKRKRPTIPPGWIAIADLAHTLNVRIPRVARIMRKQGYRTCEGYAETTRRGVQKRVCIIHADAEKVTAWIMLPASYTGRLKANEVAAQLGVTRETVMRWSARGLAKEKCCRGHSWYDMTEVRAWLARRAA